MPFDAMNKAWLAAVALGSANPFSLDRRGRGEWDLGMELDRISICEHSKSKAENDLTIANQYVQ